MMMVRLNWLGAWNLALSAVGWFAAAFLAALAGGMPTKASLWAAGVAGAASIVQHIRTSPSLVRDLIEFPGPGSGSSTPPRETPPVQAALVILPLVVLLTGCAGNAQVIRALSCDGAIISVTGFYAHLGSSYDPTTGTPQVGLTVAHGTMTRTGRIWNASDTSLSTGSSVAQGITPDASGKASTTNAGQGSLTLTDKGTNGVRTDCVGLATAPVKPH